jgi:antitoxin component YwqK of YwqJK toxin-antitoxin module
MNIYIVNINNNSNIYTKIEDIPFTINSSQLKELSENNKVSFFTQEGEVLILLSTNNKEIYNEVYKNPEPLEEDGYISISHYNNKKNLHTSSKDIPSFTNTIIDKVNYHKNGIIKKEKLKDDYGEYTLLFNKPKDVEEVRCYKNGYQQLIFNEIASKGFIFKKNSICGVIQDLNINLPSSRRYVLFNHGWELVKESYYINEKIFLEKTYNSELLISEKYALKYNHTKEHRDNGPAKILYYDNGFVSSEEYYINGVLHREDGPAHIKYKEDGSVFSEVYYINGEKHREECPAIIYYYKSGSIASEEYYLNNKKHRKDRPANTNYNENGSISFEEYYINGEYDRKDGPAVIKYYNNGSILYECYYINGKIHKEEGPAVISYEKDGSIRYESH